MENPGRQRFGEPFMRAITAAFFASMSACLFFSVPAGADQPKPAHAKEPVPPPPDPVTPVNYIAWVNDAWGGSVTDNAAKDYLAAYDTLHPFDGDWEPALSGPWSGNKAVEDWLVANKKGLALFRGAATKRACFFPLREDAGTLPARMDHALFYCVLPWLTKHRNAVRGLIAEGFHAWDQGDHDRLIDNIFVGIRAGHHLDHSATLLERLVGTADTALCYQSLRSALDLADDRGALASTVIERLERSDPSTLSLSRVCRMERLSNWDLCQRLFKPGRREGEYTFDPAPAVMGMLHLNPGVTRRVSQIGYEATLSEINAYYDVMDEVLANPFPQSRLLWERLARMVRSSKNPFVQAILPSLRRAQELDVMLTAERRATRLIAHILDHHAQKNKYPKTLSQLDAPDLDEIRVDPFSGRDFVYKLRRRAFKLHTVSLNLADDGGAHDPKWKTKDHVFWPVQHE